jgi:hypothetical protein
MVAVGARCLLAQSGWLAARWPYAARAFCHAKDVKIDYLVRVASTDGRVGTQMSETGRRVDVDLGWVLQCGGFFLDWVELAVLEPGDKSMVYRIKEVCVQNIPSRCAPPEWRQHISSACSWRRPTTGTWTTRSTTWTRPRTWSPMKMSWTGPTYLLSSKAQSSRTRLGLPLRRLRENPGLDVVLLRTSTWTT